MRVIEPRHHKYGKTKSRRGISRVVIYAIVFAIVAVAGLYVYSDFMIKPAPSVEPVSNDQSNSRSADDPFSIIKKPLKQLKGDEYKQLYLSIAYPNTQEITDPPTITGDQAADDRIRARAEARGYRLSKIPMGAIVKIKDEPRLGDDDLLQPLAAASWYRLREAARRDGYPISLLSAFRSPKYQRDLFVQRIYDQGVTDKQLASGAADEEIDITLQLTAVPGYSRHHTGYTVDFWCEDGSVAFVDSTCNEWISANNYQHAMEFGWIPSYPDGATEQGPEPEPWEYVWVGDAAVRQ